jgi:amino acid transporter
VLGTRGYTTTLDQIDAPLNVLAQMNHVNYLWPLLSAGAMFSFFALASSCMNAGARVMYAMGRHDFFHKSTSAAHETHGTPHIALSVMAIIMFSVVTVCYFVLTHFGMAVLDEFNDAGTMGAMGFTGAYILITLAAPGFLKKRGELKAKHIALSAVTLVLMLIPAIGLVYPVPAAPVNYFPYVFLAYLWFGLLRVMAMQHQKPERLVEIRDEVKKMHTATA